MLNALLEYKHQALPSENNYSNEVVCSLLGVFADWCISNEQVRLYFVHEGKVNILVGFLDKKYGVSILERTCRVLANIVMNKNPMAVQQFIEHDVLPKVVALLKDEKCRNNQLIYTKLLRQTCHHGDARDQLIKEDAVFSISKLLQLEDSDITRHVLAGFREFTLTRCTSEFADQVVRSGAIPYLMKYANCNDGPHFKNSIMLILNLTAQDIARIAIGNANGVELLIKLVTDHVVRWDKVLNALSLLCIEAVNRVRLRDAGYLELAVQFLEDKKFFIMHHRLISSLACFVYDGCSVKRLSTEKFVGIVLQHVVCNLKSSAFKCLSISDEAATFFGNLSVDNQGYRKRRKFDGHDCATDITPKTKRLKSTSEFFDMSQDLHPLNLFLPSGPEDDATTPYDNQIMDQGNIHEHHNFINCETVTASPTVGVASVSPASSNQVHKPTLRSTSPTYLAQIDKNRNSEFSLFAFYNGISGSKTRNYEPLGSVHCTMQLELDQEQPLDYRLSLNKLYSPVASPLSMSSCSSPVSVLSSSVHDYSSDEDDCEVLTYTDKDSLNASGVKIEHTSPEVHEETRYTVVEQLNPKHNDSSSHATDQNCIRDVVEVLSGISDLLQKHIVNESSRQKTDVGTCSTIDDSCSQNNLRDYCKGKHTSRCITAEVISKTSDNKLKETVDTTENKFHHVHHTIPFTNNDSCFVEDDANTNREVEGKSCETSDLTTEQNIIAILTAIAYSPNNSCLIHIQHISSLINYILCGRNCMRQKIVLALQHVLSNKLFFSKLFDMEVPRLIMKHLIEFRYPEAILSTRNEYTTPHTTRHHTNRDTGSGSTGTHQHCDNENIGISLLDKLQITLHEWYGMTTISHLLNTGDVNLAIRIGIGLLHLCRSHSVIESLLISNNLLYSLLCIFQINISDDLTAALCSGVHYIARCLKNHSLTRKDSKTEQSVTLDTSDSPNTDVTLNTTSCVYYDYDHESSLLLDDRVYPINRSVMCESSPVFEAMLRGSFVESTQDTIRITPLSYTNHSSFSCILHYLHGCGLSCPSLHSLQPNQSNDSNALLLKLT